MEENKDFGLTNEGTDGVVQVPVELKDHSKDPVIVPEVKVEATVVEKKKRGRPKKAAKADPIREFRCSTCREVYTDLTVMKMGAGEGRWAIFCPVDQKALGFLSDLDEKVAKLIRDNPTGK